MKQHPQETELALAASGDGGVWAGFRLRRHLKGCTECQLAMESFTDLRGALSADLARGPNWDERALEMRANIRLALEAGECVREPMYERGASVAAPTWNPRFALALASLFLLAGAGIFLRETPTAPANSVVAATRVASPILASASAILASSDAGIEFRSGETSVMLLNRNGVVADQTVSTLGEIRSRYIDGDTGAVTINNVYLQ